MRVTLEDVARVARVSTKTVSRVINNEPAVAADTRERVVQAIRSLNYVPNSAARNLSRGRAMAIGLVVGWSVNSAFSSMLIDAMLQDTLHKGYSLVLFSSNQGTAGRVTKALLGNQIDGVIMDSAAANDPELIAQLEAMKRPHLIIHPDFLDRYSRASFVRIDNFEGAKKATEYLLGLGHRAIGLVSYPPDRPGNERHSGYQAALAEAGVTPDPAWVYDCSLELPVQIGYKGALELVPHHPELTAIFAATDEIAIGVLTALWQLGMRIPEDVSVVGFDDISLASVITPPLTTVHQPIDVISRVAVELMVEMIEDPGGARKDVVLPTSLVVRDSSAPPRSEGRGPWVGDTPNSLSAQGRCLA